MFGWLRRVARCASSTNMARKRRDEAWAGWMRLRTRSLNVPAAPSFFPRKTSAIPPAPSRLRISKLASFWGVLMRYRGHPALWLTSTRPLPRSALRHASIRGPAGLGQLIEAKRSRIMGVWSAVRFGSL